MFSREQYAAAAEELGCEPEMIEAVAVKEVGKQKWYFTSGKRQVPKILYERHTFWDLLEAKGVNPRQLLSEQPGLSDVLASYPYKRYGRFMAQYERRDKAIWVDREAAFGACSYSAFQIMGYHHKRCGYMSAELFAEAMSDPDNHLPAFVAFIKDQGLEKFLQERDFESFAKRYNGKNYWKKGYHIELSRIYQRVLARNLPRHESTAKALTKSQTVKRTAAVVTTAVVPAAPLALDLGDLTGLIDQAKALSNQGQAVLNNVEQLHQKAEVVSQQMGFVFDWLPWLSGGWTLLLLVMFYLVARRYLLDRGYL